MTSAPIPFRLVVALAASWIAVAPCRAQDAGAENDEALVNYPFTLGTGWDAFHVEGRSVQLVRLPIAYRLRSLDKGDGWGLKLTLPVSFGVHEIKVTEMGSEATRRLRTMTVVPGAELGIPVGERWTLKPFGELGVGKDFEGGDVAAIYSAGLKSLGTWPVKDLTLSFGNSLGYSGSTTFDGRPSQGFTTLELGLDALRPLGPTLWGRDVDASAYLIVRRFFDLDFVVPEGETLEVRYLYEVGVTFGTRPRLKIWRLELPRIGVSYRFGDGLTSWRINFGFPF